MWSVWKFDYLQGGNEKPILIFHQQKDSPSLSLQNSYAQQLSEIVMQERFTDPGSQTRHQITADRFFCFVDFLHYHKLSVYGEDVSYSLIGHMIGKLLYHGARMSPVDEKGRDYTNMYYVEAYSVFSFLCDNVSYEDTYYVLISYYSGLVGLNMLEKIDSTEQTSYDRVLSESKRHMETAYEYLNQYPSKYRKEPNMLTNMKGALDIFDRLEK